MAQLGGKSTSDKATRDYMMHEARMPQLHDSFRLGPSGLGEIQ